MGTQLDTTICDNSKRISPLHRDKFKMEVKSFAKMHTQLTKIMTFFLAFYVGTMMTRWWCQVSSLPDISVVAMTLNGLVKTTKGSMELKKSILRYCLLSYHAVIIQITRYNKNCKIPAPQEKQLLLSNEAQKFNIGSPRNWWLPTNETCTLVQASRDEMIKDVKEVIAAICKFDKSLHTLMDFNENPLPDLCAQVCHLACWMYAILGAVAFQTCSGEHEWFWIPLLDFPYFPILTIMMMFAWLRMGAICTSPFDGDGHFDLNMHQKLDAEIFKASLALYKGNRESNPKVHNIQIPTI